MERILKVLDDVDDALASLRQKSPKFLATVLLLLVFATVVTALFVYGPPDLLAAD